MKARALIANASFGPDELKIIGKAFDDAWGQLEPQFRASSPESVEAARLVLADAVLSLARNGHPPDDATTLTEAALELVRTSPLGQTGEPRQRPPNQPDAPR